MDTQYFWIGCNQFPPCNYSVPVLMRVMYSLELGFYLQVGFNTSSITFIKLKEIL